MLEEIVQLKKEMAGTTLGLDESLKSVEFIPQIFGFCPYNREGKKLKLSYWKTAYTLTLTALLLTGVGYRLAQAGLEPRSEWKIKYFKTIVITLTSTVSILATLFSLPHLEQALHALRSSGVVASSYDGRKSYNILFLVLFIILVPLDSYVYRKTAYWDLTVGYCFAALTMCACIDLFSGYISIMTDSFGQMKKWIQAPRPHVEIAICSFERVTTAAEYLNEAFGIQLLAIVGCNFILLTVNAFLVVQDNDYIQRSLFAIWCGAYASFPVRVVYATDRLLNQRNEFNNALNALIVRGHVFATALESGKVKLHVAMKQELEFTAKGFFSLNYGLINSMLGAVTTYLVILIQFNGFDG